MRARLNENEPFRITSLSGPYRQERPGRGFVPPVVRSLAGHVATAVRQAVLATFVLVFAILALKAASLSASAQDAFGDGIDEGPCGRWDPDCRRHIEEVFFQGAHIARPEIEGGVRFGHGAADAAIRFGIDLVDLETMHGDVGILPFEAMWLPDAGGFRIRFTLADSEVSFFCTDLEGDINAPQNFVNLYEMIKLSLGASPGRLPDGCRETGMVGLGGSLIDVQADTGTGRWAVRWAEINAVLNFLRNGNSQSYLKRRLTAFAGASVDTVWPGSTPGAPDGNADTMLRLNMGVTGMLRTNDSRWEFRGYAGYRPSVTDWTDFAIEARAEVLYNLLFTPDLMGSIGLTGEYSYWSVPSRSVGTYASDRDLHTTFVGAMFRLHWN